MADIKVWRCSVCGYEEEATEPPEVCPVCGAGSDAFVVVED